MAGVIAITIITGTGMATGATGTTTITTGRAGITTITAITTGAATGTITTITAITATGTIGTAGRPRLDGPPPRWLRRGAAGSGLAKAGAGGCAEMTIARRPTLRYVKF